MSDQSITVGQRVRVYAAGDRFLQVGVVIRIQGHSVTVIFDKTDNGYIEVDPAELQPV